MATQTIKRKQLHKVIVMQIVSNLIEFREKSRLVHGFSSDFNLVIEFPISTIRWQATPHTDYKTK